MSEIAEKTTTTITPRLTTVTIGGVVFHVLSEAGCVAHVFGQLERGLGGWIVTANLDHVRRAQKGDYAELIRLADVVVADGMPIVWAAALQGTPLPERVAGSDLVSSLARRAAAHGRSIFLLGGDPGTAEAASEVLTRASPKLKIAGTLCPPRGFEKTPQMAEIEQALVDASPDLVYVALGSPKQELLIKRCRVLLPRTWWVGVGISFSYLAPGGIKRPPVWLQRVGGEWLLRLVQEPRRMARRYLVHGVPFALYLLGQSLLKRIGWSPDDGSG